MFNLVAYGAAFSTITMVIVLGSCNESALALIHFWLVKVQQIQALGYSSRCQLCEKVFSLVMLLCMLLIMHESSR